MASLDSSKLVAEKHKMNIILTILTIIKMIIFPHGCFRSRLDKICLTDLTKGRRNNVSLLNCSCHGTVPVGVSIATEYATTSTLYFYFTTREILSFFTTLM